jgi:hypothetical protein
MPEKLGPGPVRPQRPRKVVREKHQRLATGKALPYTRVHGDIDERVLDCGHQRTFSLLVVEINGLLITTGRKPVQRNRRLSAEKVNAACGAQLCCSAQ